MSYGFFVPRLEADAYNCPNCGAAPEKGRTE
jgi:predicted RNA-binding Zn-ribbon protein involved in translation (DUF1610 family)